MTNSEPENFCDKVNLNQFTQIQSHGGILVLDESLHVIQYSENIPSLLNTPLEQLLASPVPVFLESEDQEENIADWLIQKDNQSKCLDWNSPQNKIKVWVFAHQVPEGTVLEVELFIENDIKDTSLFGLVQNVVEDMKLITSSQSMEDLIQNACLAVQKITGFDRVMVYQFSKLDYSGVVVGETIQSYMESYKGLNFPATDIPMNVRAKYLTLPIRYIPDVDYTQVKIVPEINPTTKTHLNLSDMALRMVAPVHIKYLHNMGVSSATSIAIIHNNKLWGLIACHHKEPKYLSVNLRLVLILIGYSLGVQIASLECSKEYLFEQNTSDQMSSLTENIYKMDSLLNALDSYHLDMMKLVGATGVSIYFQNNLLIYGETPTQDQVMGLMNWLHTTPIQSSYSTSSLPLTFEACADYKDKACGILVVPLTPLQNDFIIFYRPELLHSIYWAGNPSESINWQGDQYSPRNSFDMYMQNITNQAAPWTTHDIKAAGLIRSTVINKQLQDLLQVQAMHDPLTGLLNRLYLDQRLDVEINRAGRQSEHLAIILADLDLFKNINDSFGHQAGDYVLSEFAKFLKKCFRGYDYIYRFGGEEFLIILPATNDAAAIQKAETLRVEIKNLKLEYAGKVLPAISISAGIAMYPDNGSDCRSLIAAADVALYKAKSFGRDKVVSARTH